LNIRYKPIKAGKKGWKGRERERERTGRKDEKKREKMIILKTFT
jgi:hypothetical protein